MKAAKAVPAAVLLLNEKGLGRAYIGGQIMPFLGDVGGAECLPELQRVLDAPDGHLFQPLPFDEAWVKRRAVDAMKAISKRIA